MKTERPSREALIRYYRGECFPQEERLIDIYLSMDTDHGYVESCLREAWNNLDDESEKLLTEQQKNIIWDKFQQKKADLKRPSAGHDQEEHSATGLIDETPVIIQKHRTRLYLRIAAAAAVLLFSIIGAYLIINKWQVQIQVVKNTHKDIQAGKNKAILTLANGSKINLDAAVNGQVAKQTGIIISKASNGQVVYTVAGHTTNNSKPEFNTIETPRGGQYRINLPDGTKVWLNAASSITFPTAFTGNERNVTLAGEGYFEVTHHVNKPFNVYASGIQISVLGTHFNVNAYQDEETVKTTLAAGAVRLTHHHATALLKPGQQGKIKIGDTHFDVSQADTALVTAWKDELFKFDNTDLRSLMRQLSRWYNIDVVYEGNVPNDVFFGKIERKANLSKVLKILELGDVHFKIDGKKLIVMP